MRYQGDWVTIAILACYYLVISRNIEPFARQFSINDASISFPYIHENFSSLRFAIVGVGLPLTIIVVMVLVKHRNELSSAKCNDLLCCALLGYFMSFAVTGVFTDFLKITVAKPLPDFLNRCRPKDVIEPVNGMLTLDDCSAPLGHEILMEGLRSFPSSQAALGFSSLTYLTLFIVGQYKLYTSRKFYVLLLSLIPLLVATYLAISKTQFYSHSFVDVTVGGAIGFFMSIGVYHHYFNYLSSDTADHSQDRLISPLPH